MVEDVLEDTSTIFKKHNEINKKYNLIYFYQIYFYNVYKNYVLIWHMFFVHAIDTAIKFS